MKVMTDKIKGFFSQLTKKKRTTTPELLHPFLDGHHQLQVGLDLEHSVLGLTLRRLELHPQQKDRQCL